MYPDGCGTGQTFKACANCAGKQLRACLDNYLILERKLNPEVIKEKEVIDQSPKEEEEIIDVQISS